MDEENKDYSRLKEVESLAIKETVENIDRKKKSVNDYIALKDKLVELPDRLSYNIMVPFGSRAFMPGRLRKTNCVTMLLGDNWFAEVSTKHAAAIVARRIASLSESIEGLEKQKELLQNNLKATKEFVEESDEVVEIREDYDEEADERWRKKRKASRVQRRLDNECKGTEALAGGDVSDNLEGNEEEGKEGEIEFKEDEVKKENNLKGGNSEKENKENEDPDNDKHHMKLLLSDDDEDNEDGDEKEQEIWSLIDVLSEMKIVGSEDECDDVGDEVVQMWVTSGEGNLHGRSLTLVGDFSDVEQDDGDDVESDDIKGKSGVDDDDGRAEIKKTVRFMHTTNEAVHPQKHAQNFNSLNSPSDIYSSYKSAQKKNLKKRVSFSDSISYLGSERQDPDTQKSEESSSSLPSSTLSSSSFKLSNNETTKVISRFKQERLRLKQNM